jgi:hypothetical protein
MQIVSKHFDLLALVERKLSYQLMQESAVKPTAGFVELGYRGVDSGNLGVRIAKRDKPKRISEQDKGLFKQRKTIEPIIGYLKSHNRMDRYHLKGESGKTACGPVRYWLQNPVVAANDCPKEVVTLLNMFTCACKSFGV